MSHTSDKTGLCTAAIPAWLTDQGAFCQTFEHVFEHSPWIVAETAAKVPFADDQAAFAALEKTVRSAPVERILALICAHPDLAGKTARAGKLTPESTTEQAGAGLDRLTDEEYERFHGLNTSYRSRFGFPFIIAVKGLDKSAILAAFTIRLANDPETERASALTQVLKIARYRFDDTVGALTKGRTRHPPRVTS